MTWKAPGLRTGLTVQLVKPSPRGPYLEVFREDKEAVDLVTRALQMPSGIYQTSWLCTLYLDDCLQTDTVACP